jgi:hypothetical protein
MRHGDWPHALKSGSVFVVRIHSNRSVASHIRLERVLDDCPKVSVLLPGDGAENFDQFK